MSRLTERGEVGFTARVPIEDKRTFEALLPMHGGPSWFIETALERFVSEIEASPERRQAVMDAIYKMLVAGSPRNIEPFMPRIDAGLVARFNRLLPIKGATTWFIRTLIRRYIEYQEIAPTPEEVLTQTVHALIDKPTQ